MPEELNYEDTFDSGKLNGNLKFLQIEILFQSVVYLVNLLVYHCYDRGSVDRNSVDRNCVLSLDRNCVNHLTKFLDTFHLIESFNNDFSQTPKF